MAEVKRAIKLSIRANPDSEVYAMASKAVELNGGYCPCSLKQTPDTKCMCKSFREKQEEGECQCGRFIKTTADNT